jgi:hypothetical protein
VRERKRWRSAVFSRQRDRLAPGGREPQSACIRDVRVVPSPTVVSSPRVSSAVLARRHQRLCAAWLALAVAICASDAGAQPRPPASARAQSQDEFLFYRGQELWEAKRYAEACADFIESQRLSPHPIKLLNVGECHEHELRLATAFRTYEEALRQALLEPNTPDRQSTTEVARKLLRELEPSVPTLRLVPSPTPGAVVQLDGQPQPLGETLRVDPGMHHLEVSAPGYQTHRDSVPLAEAQRLEYALPALSPVPAQSSRFGLAPPVLVGAGALVGGAAVYYGLGALASGRRLEDRCTEGVVSASCDQLDEEWKTKADTASWLWVAAGLLAGTGITLFVLESHPSSSAQAQPVSSLDAWVGPGAAGLSASGRF